MASNTAATRVKRKNKHEKAGRRRKNRLAKKSTAVGDRAVRRASASPASRRRAADQLHTAAAGRSSLPRTPIAARDSARWRGPVACCLARRMRAIFSAISLVGLRQRSPRTTTTSTRRPREVRARVPRRARERLAARHRQGRRRRTRRSRPSCSRCSRRSRIRTAAASARSSRRPR